MYCLLLLKCNKNYCEVEIMMKADCVKISFTLNVMNNKLVTNISIIYGHVLHFLIFLQLMVNYLHKYVYKTILQVFHTMFRYFTAILSQNLSQPVIQKQQYRFPYQCSMQFNCKSPSPHSFLHLTLAL